MRKIYILIFSLLLFAASGLGQTFNSSGTYTVGTGVTSIKVEVWGAGGGGATAGGGGGGYASSSLTVTPGQSFTFTVGTGGTAANPGGNSSFATLVVAGGGQGATSRTSPGAGGTGITGTTLFSGGRGGYGWNNNTNSGGGGGGSAFTNANGNNGNDAPNNLTGGTGGAGTGNGGNGASRSPQVSATPGIAPGGGGGGRASNGGGSASGANGRVIVTVNSTPTTTSTTVSPSSFVYGTTSTTFTATVTDNPGGGTIQFTVDGSINAGTASVNAGTGVATLNYNPSALNAGTHSVVAVFSGFGTYATSTATAANFTITPKPITVTGVSANNKIYDGTTTATFNTGSPTFTGVINGDGTNLNVASATGTFATKDVANGIAVTFTGVTLGGTKAGNYSISPLPNNVSANITPKPLTASSTVSKVYDATNSALAVTVGTVLGYVGSETLAITASASDYVDPNVGNTKATTITYNLANGTNGELASNYSMAVKPITTGVITKRPITITAANNTKVFDGTTSALAAPILTSGTLAGSDALNFTESYNNKNVGINNKILVPAGTVSDGNGGNNYAVTFANYTTGTITAQPITVTASPNTKTYDGNVTATTPPVVTGTIFPGDSPNFTEAYSDKNAGSGKLLTPVGSISDGNGGNNYAVTIVPATVGVINQRPVTVTAVTNTKPYDGNTSATGVPTANAGALQPGDTPGFTETYDNENAGTNKVLAPAGTVSDGNSGNNYAYTFVPNNTGIITPLVLTYTATPASRIYGVANPGLSGTVTGFLSGENIANATTGTMAFTTTAVITSPIGSYPITGSGLVAINGNYTFVQAAVNATAFTITQANLSITPTNQIKCAGSVFTFAGTEFTSTGLVNSDAVTSVTLTSTGAATGAAPGVYPIVANAAVGSGLGNYNITYNTGSTLTVNARPTAHIASINTAICNPGTTHITGTVTAVGEWTLQLSDGQTLTNTGGTFDFTVSPTVPNTTYTLTSLSDANCTSIAADLTGSTTVTVHQPIAITAQPDPSQKVCGFSNTPVSFTVAADGDGKTYQWFKDDLLHPVGTNSPTYTIPNPVATDAGNYFVVVSGLSPCISARSDMAELIVNQAITISAITPATQTICEGGTATFTVTATGTGLQYFWRKGGNTLVNGGNISGANTNSLTINPATVSDAGNNYNLIIQGDDNVCAQAFSPLPNSILIVNKKSANPTSASASVTTTCAGSPTILKLNGGGGGTGEIIHWYTEDNGGGTAVGTGNNITVNPATTTTYYGRYEDGSPCNYNSTSASVTVNVDPVSVGGTATMTNPSVCYGFAPSGDITLTGNVGGIQWQKSTNPAFPPGSDIVGAVGNTLTSAQIGNLTISTYIRAVVKSGVCGVDYSNPITITINALPTILSVTNNSICGDGVVLLSVTASAGATVDWYTTLTGGSPVAIGTVTYSPNITGSTTFYAEARNTTSGCISSVRSAVTATEKPVPDALLSPSGDQTVCSGLPITSVAITNPNEVSGTTYTFSSNNVNVTGISGITGGNMISGTVTNSQNTPQTITYSITPVADGCTGTPATVKVKVNPKPTISVPALPTAVCYNTSITFITFNPNGVSGTTFSWSRTTPAGIQAGPATSGTGNVNQTLVNTTNSNITVTYTLTATSPDGCFSTTTKDVILYAQFKSDNFLIGYGQTVCTGSTPDSLKIVSPVTGGSGNFTYQWLKSGSPVGTSERYLPAAPNVGTTDSYSLHISDIAGCGNANSNTVTIGSAVDFGLDVSGTPESAQLNFCNQYTFSHTISSRGIVGLFSGDMKFSWRSPDGFITSTTNPDPNTYGQRVGGSQFFGLWFGGHFEGTAIFKGSNLTNHTINTSIYITPRTVTSFDLFGVPIGGCTLNTITVPVTIYPVATMTATPSSQTICDGSPTSIVLKGNITDAKTTFDWTASVYSGSASGFSLSGSSGEINAGSTYTLAETLQNTGSGLAVVRYVFTPTSNGCSDITKRVTVDITINKINSGIIAGDQTICYGGAPTMLTSQTNATGAVTPTYQWQSSTTGCEGTFGDIFGEKNSTYTPPLNATTTITYRRVATSTSGTTACSAISNCVTVIVRDQLTASISPGTTPICQDGNSTIFFSGTPNSEVTYSTTNPISTGNLVTLDNTGKYTLNASGLSPGSHTYTITGIAYTGNTCSISANGTATITVNPLQPVSVTITSDKTTICAGEVIKFTATPVNQGTSPGYQWYINNVAYTGTGANSAVVNISTLANGDVVTFKVNSNITPCIRDNPATSGPIAITVNDLQPVSVTIAAAPSTPTNICAGGNVIFNATPVNGGLNPSYQWKVNGSNVGTNSDSYSSSTWSNNDVVTCVVTSDITPCKRNDPATSNGVSVTIKPNATAGTINNATPTNMCVGGTSYTYIVQGNNASGTWSNSDNNGVFSVDGLGKVTALVAGTAHLRYTVSNSCTPEAYVEVLLTVGETPDKPSAITGTLQVCSSTNPGTYSVESKPGLTYHWSVPTGWSFDGQGTNEITIKFPITTGGTVSVNATTSNFACTASPASTLPVNVTTSGTWLGITPDWNNTGNWCGGVLPASATNVIIPVTGNNPVISAATATANNITMAATATLTITGQTLELYGSLTAASAGAVDASNGTIEYKGAGPSAQTITGNTFKDKTIKDLKVSNPAGLILSAGATDNLNITGFVNFGVGNATFTTNDNLTLKSTAAGTASVGVLQAGNDITGRVTVERYINVGTGGGYHGKSWQFVATPTGGQSPAQGQTVKESWMEDGTFPTGYGTQIIGPGGTANGFDNYSTQLPSLKYFDHSNDSWVGIANTAIPVYNQKGYMLFVRGDRSVSFPLPSNNTVLRTQGTLFTAKNGNQPPQTTVLADKFESVGNPYASAIDMRKIGVIDGAVPIFIVWDPALGGAYGLGAYQTLAQTKVLGSTDDNFYPSPGGGSYGSFTTANNFIQSGQAFFAQAITSSDGTITFDETAKAGPGSYKNVLRGGAAAGTTSMQSQLRATLYGVSSDTSTFLTDGNLVQFSESYSNKLDRLDARKQVNSAENLGIRSGGEQLAIERRHGIAESDTIFYNLSGARAQKYLLEFNASDLSGYGVEGYVEDTYLNTQTPLNMEGVTKVNFAVTGVAGSRAANRFRIVFRQAVALPVTFVLVKASQKDADVVVEWKVENEKDMQQYEVEKSSDGVRFAKSATVAAVNNGTQGYKWLDEHPAPGINYYRIRSVGKDGKVNYSTIVKVDIAFAKPSIGIYPNPITDGIIHLQLINQPEGMYGMRLLNSLGQVIVSKQVGHGGGNATENIKWDYNLAHGVYHLEVTKPGGEVVVIKVLY